MILVKYYSQLSIAPYHQLSKVWEQDGNYYILAQKQKKHSRNLQLWPLKDVQTLRIS